MNRSRSRAPHVQRGFRTAGDDYNQTRPAGYSCYAFRRASGRASPAAKRPVTCLRP